jgi:hypothetical protein
MSSKPSLSILQYNAMKSKNKVMARLLWNERIKNFDVIAIQEPWRNEYINTIHYPCGKFLDLVCLDDSDTRTCVFINERISRERWTVTLHSPNFCAVTVKCTSRDDAEIVYIHNVYDSKTTYGRTPARATTPTRLRYLRRSQWTNHN